MDDTSDYDRTPLTPNRYAEGLKRNYSAHFFRWSFAQRFIKSYHDVLEVGCGADVPLARILTGNQAPAVGSYYGVDLWPLPKTGNVRLTYRGEFNFVERWKEIKEKFDVVLSLEVIEHMKVHLGDELLRGCYELLRDDGVFILSTPAYDGKKMAKNHIHEYYILEMQASLEKTGFKVCQRFGTYMDLRQVNKSDDPLIHELRAKLETYFDNNAVSCIMAPFLPDLARNCLWVCEKEK